MNHVEKMLSDLSLHFSSKQLQGEQHAINWAKSWAIAFKKTEPWLLEAATQRIIENRKERSFPLIHDVHEAIKEVRDLERMNNPKMKVAPQEQYSNPFELADQLVNCQLGRTAARANPSWIIPLHDFCRDNRRLPLSNEIDRLKRIADDGEQIEYAIAIGKVTELTPALRESRERLRIRREKLRRRLLGDEADAPVASTFVPDPDWIDRERALYRAKMSERDRLAAEWRDKITAEWGSVDRFLSVKRPPGNVAQNKRG